MQKAVKTPFLLTPISFNNIIKKYYVASQKFSNPIHRRDAEGAPPVPRFYVPLTTLQ